MIPALFRVIYLFGPIISLALILMPVRRTLAWTLWAIAAVVVAFHWLFYLSAEDVNATMVGTFGIAVWTPLVAMTGLAGLTNNRWRGWHSNPFISQGVMCAICLAPSVLAFFLTR